MGKKSKANKITKSTLPSRPARDPCWDLVASRQEIRARRKAIHDGVDWHVADGMDEDLGNEWKKAWDKELYRDRREEQKSVGLEPRGRRSKAKAAKHALTQQRKRAEQLDWEIKGEKWKGRFWEEEEKKDSAVADGHQGSEYDGGVAASGGEEGLDDDVGMSAHKPMLPGAWAGSAGGDDDDNKMEM